MDNLGRLSAHTGRTNGLNSRPIYYGANRCGRGWDADPDADDVYHFGKLDTDPRRYQYDYRLLKCDNPKCLAVKWMNAGILGAAYHESEHGIRWLGLCRHERARF